MGVKVRIPVDGQIPAVLGVADHLPGTLRNLLPKFGDHIFPNGLIPLDFFFLFADDVPPPQPTLLSYSRYFLLIFHR